MQVWYIVSRQIVFWWWTCQGYHSNCQASTEGLCQCLRILSRMPVMPGQDWHHRVRDTQEWMAGYGQIGKWHLMTSVLLKRLKLWSSQLLLHREVEVLCGNAWPDSCTQHLRHSRWPQCCEPAGCCSLFMTWPTKSQQLLNKQSRNINWLQRPAWQFSSMHPSPSLTPKLASKEFSLLHRSGFGTYSWFYMFFLNTSSMFLSSDLLCQVSKPTFPHVTLHKRRADGDFATSCTSPSLALPHSGPRISSCCGHPAEICTEVMALAALERVSQCGDTFPNDWTHRTFFHFLWNLLCRDMQSYNIYNDVFPPFTKAIQSFLSIDVLVLSAG